MVLGDDWVREHTPVTFDYDLYELKVKEAGKMMTLKRRNRSSCTVSDFS